MTRETGHILQIREDIRGTIMEADASSGAATITVADPLELNEDGGQVSVVVDGTSHLLTYTAVNDDTGVVTLSGTIPTAFTGGMAVLLEPRQVSRYAVVQLEDAPEAPLQVLVPHTLVGRLPAGIRGSGDTEAVTVVEDSPGSWVVQDVFGAEFVQSGLEQTDWRNEFGFALIGGDPDSDTALGVYGIAAISAEMVMTGNGPFPISVPPSAGATVRKVGATGSGTGPLTFDIDRPVKITAEAMASVLNDSAADWNVQFFVCVDVDGASAGAGRQCTAWTISDDKVLDKHRQVVTTRQVFVDASPTSVKTIALWWGFQNATAINRNATIRNAKMTVRVSYAPDIPTASQPDREPSWAPSANFAAAYKLTEGNDLM